MGRQKGPKNRSKEVASSSSQAFKKIQTAATFESFEGDYTYVPVSSLSNQELSIPSEYRIALTKLSKKDTITKQKALAELTELCKQNCDVQLILQILPYWAQNFNKLCYEKDGKVRAAAHSAMKIIVEIAGKEFAPYLKKVIGWWWISQDDFYSISAKSANESFLAAFQSQEKQSQVLLFCHEEIVKLINQNVFVSDLRKLTDTSKEEDFAEKIIASSLKSFGSFVSHIYKTEKNEKAKKTITNFIGKSRFWKLNKHKSLKVRQMYYYVISELSTCFPNLLIDHLSSLEKSVFHNLHDTNGSVMKYIWLAASSITSNIENCFEFVDVRAGYLPQFYKSLEKGFYGFASQICKYLPDIVRKFPDSIKSDVDVHSRLFNAFKQSINVSNDSLLPSVAETKALIIAMIECYEIVLLEDNFSEDFKAKCVDTMLDWFSNCTGCSKADNWNKHSWKIYIKVFALLIKKLEKNKEKINGSVLLKVWDFFETTFKNKVEQTNMKNFDEMEFLINCYQLFFESLCESTADSCTYQSFMSKKVNFDSNKIILNQTAPDSFITSSPVLNILTEFLVVTMQSKITSINKFDIVDKLILKYLSKKLLKIFNTKLNYKSFLIDSFVPIILTLDTLSLSTAQLGLIKSIVYKCLDFSNKGECIELISKITTIQDLNFVLTLLSTIIENNRCYEYIKDWLKEESCFLNDFLLFNIQDACTEQTLVFLLFNFEKTSNVKSVKLNKKFCIKFILKLQEDFETLLTKNESFLSVFEHVLSTCMEAFNDECSVKQTFQVFKKYIFRLFRSKKYSKVCELFATIVNNDKFVHFFDVLGDFESSAYGKFILDVVKEIKFQLLTKQFIDTKTPLSIIDSIISAKKSVQLPAESLMFEQKDWLNFHKEISSNDWVNEKNMVKSYHIGMTLPQDQDKNQVLEESYLTAVSFFSNLCTNFSQDFNIQANDKKCVAIECLLVCSFCQEKRLILGFFSDQEELLKNLIDIVVTNSLKYGNAWCILLKTLLKYFSVTHQLISLEMEKACEDINLHSIVQSLTVYISNLSTLNGVQEIAIKLHMSFLELQNDESSFFKTGFYLSVLVKALDRLAELNSLLYEEMVSSLIDNTSEFKNVMEIESSITSQDKQSINFGKGLLTLFNQVAKYLPLSKVSLTSGQWDSVLCNLLGMVDSLQQSLGDIECLQNNNFYTLLFGCCKLVNKLNDYLKSDEANQDPALPASLISEWKDFYLVNSQQALLNIYLKASCSPDFKYTEMFLEVMCPILCEVEYSTLLSQTENLEKYIRPDCEYEDDVQTLVYSLMHHCSGVTLLDKFICNKLMNTLLCQTETLKHNKPPQKVMRSLYDLSINVETDFFNLKEAEKKRVKVKHIKFKKTDEDNQDDYFQGL